MTDATNEVPEADKVREILALIADGSSERNPELPAYIYGLYDEAGDLRYIGKANCVKSRLATHVSGARRKNTPVCGWIRKNGEPEIRVLEVCDQKTWPEAERRLIREARESGQNLLNVADGGDAPYCPPEVRSENGRKTVRRFTGKEPFNEIRETPESLIISTYNWLGKFARKTGNLSLAARIELKKRECFAEDPKTYKRWARA